MLKITLYLGLAVKVAERFRGNVHHVRSLEQCVHSRDEQCLGRTCLTSS